MDNRFFRELFDSIKNTPQTEVINEIITYVESIFPTQCFMGSL